MDDANAADISPDVEALARQADLVDVPPTPAGLPAPAPASDASVQIDECARELAPLLLLLGSMMSYAWPRVADVYTETTCNQTARACAPALIKAGWWKTGTDGAVYLVAAGALVSLAVQTKAAIDASKRDRPQTEQINEFQVPAS